MKACAICGKTSMMGGKRNLLRGKYNPTPKKRKYPNLQYARVPASPTSQGGPGKTGRVLLCARCLKQNRHLRSMG